MKDTAEPAVYLASDRGRERLLDRARRLATDGRWSDAAAACDELLGEDQDAFIDAIDSPDGRGSIRSHAAALIAGFPRAGREAYLLLYRTRAEKRLAEAITRNDREEVMAVARRWFETPAGRHAALIAAMTALEEGQSFTAAMWLDRVAASEGREEFEPTLSVMRAIARRQTGDADGAAEALTRTTRIGSGLRIGGRDWRLSGLPTTPLAWLDDIVRPVPSGSVAARGDWLQARGTPSRNAVVEASKPLLVPRYRVPLVRHPDEARKLEHRRRMAADAGVPLLPAGQALAVGEFVVVHTPLGILAIEFASGKRVWLESSVAPAEPDDLGGASVRVFDDVTSGNLASDGRLVFAVETPAEAFAVMEPTVGGIGFGRGFAARQTPSWNGGNSLLAYDLSDGGTVRWRLPRTEPAEGGPPNESAPWFLGPPLVAGSDLFMLVEEGGDVRLECRRADDGTLRWQQRLASYDDRESITNPEARARRLAGLTPALADGVLVCPLGAGCIVAVDTATRSLLWSHTYARVTPAENSTADFRSPPSEPCAVIADGCAVLSPYDAPGLFCLGLRDGKPLWPQAKRGRYRVAGVIDRRAMVISDSAIEAIDVATSHRIWKLPLADVGRPSGQGILTPRSLLLPLDTPEVVEINLADGRIKGRSRARGGSVPGNLVAHRGEIVSRGVDALEVFHQEMALDVQIETAKARDPSSPWADYWGGQVAIEQGDVQRGLDLVARAVASSALKLPPGDLSATLVRALDRDFTVAAAWQASRDHGGTNPAVSRKLVDGFLAIGDARRAWTALGPLLVEAGSPGETVIRDATDPWLAIDAGRWIRGRLGRIVTAADASLAGQIDKECRRLIELALARTDTPEHASWREALAERLGAHPAAPELRQLLFANGRADGSRQATVRESLTSLETDATFGATGPFDDTSPWPLGAVVPTTTVSPPRQTDHARMHPVSLRLNGAAQFGARAAQAMFDGIRRRLMVTDGFGNAVGEPVLLDGVGHDLMPWGNRTGAIEVAVVGRALVVRTRKELAAYDLEAGPGSSRGLWRRPDHAAIVDATGEARWGGGVGGRVARDGWVPLGMRISEPDELPRNDGRGLVARPEFLLVPGPRSIALLDPASGRLLWERRRLPAGLEWTVDGKAVCGLTNDGLRSVVLDASDGRVLHQLDIPHRRQRLATHGRCIVTIRSIDELPGRFTARRVRLELIDPATRQTRSLGEFSGDARATEAGPGRIAVMEPGGHLTMLDLDAATIAFHVTLPDPPRPMSRLVVQSWQDRYLVLAGSPTEGDDAAGVSPLQQLMMASPASAPMSGRLWAVDRMNGKSLWQAPAIIERHCLHTAQPPELPVLTFCRLLHGPGERDQTRLSVLMLDKRTGHAVLDEDRIPVPSHAYLGCEISGNPETHAISIGEPGSGAARLTLTFTGGPISPQPPYRGPERLQLPRRPGGLQGASPVFDDALRAEDDAPPPDPLPFEPEDFE